MLDQYRKAFSQLRTNKNRTVWPARTCHQAPHKPLLLLSVMDLLAQGSMASNLVALDPELGELFTLYWASGMLPELTCQAYGGRPRPPHPPAGGKLPPGPCN